MEKMNMRKSIAAIVGFLLAPMISALILTACTLLADGANVSAGLLVLPIYYSASAVWRSSWECRSSWCYFVSILCNGGPRCSRVSLSPHWREPPSEASQLGLWGFSQWASQALRLASRSG